MSAPTAKLKLTLTKRANKDLAYAPGAHLAKISAPADKLRLFPADRAFDDLESTLNALLEDKARNIKEYQRFLGVLEQTKVKLVAIDARNHTPMSTDFEASLNTAVPVAPNHESTSGPLEVLRSFIAALEVSTPKHLSTDLEVLRGMESNIGCLSRALKKAVKARKRSKDRANKLMMDLREELRQVREELGQVKAECTAKTAEAKRLEDILYVWNKLSPQASSNEAA
jgi:hypothetical protein